MTVGDLLIEAKAHPDIKHGQWLPWLEEHCAMSVRTAQLYMRTSQHRATIEAEGKCASLAYLTLEGAAKLLAKPSERKDVVAMRDTALAEDHQQRRGLLPGWLRKPLPDCPVCEGSGSIRVDLYTPCGRKQTAEPVPTACACVQQKPRPSIDELKVMAATEAAARKAMTATEAAVLQPSASASASARVASDEELALLREFARFVIGRATVKTDPMAYREWRGLLDRVKAILPLLPGMAP